MWPTIGERPLEFSTTRSDADLNEKIIAGFFRRAYFARRVYLAFLLPPTSHWNTRRTSRSSELSRHSRRRLAQETG